MRRPARWIAIGVGALVVVFGVVLALNVGTDPLAASRSTRLLDKPAPEIDLVDFEGDPVTSDLLAGKTVFVNFWNEWCEPCLEELPALKAFWASHAGDTDVEMIGVVHDSHMSKSKLVKQAARDGLDWTLAFDPGQRAALDFAVRGQPETFVISPSGRIVGYQFGPATVAGLEAMLDAARAVG